MMTTNMIDDVQSEDDQYKRFERNLRATFDFATEDSPPLFTTDATDLFAAFLDALPAERRQHYTCNSCRHFVERFGGLALVRPADGSKFAAMWQTSGAPAFFAKAVADVARRVARAKITGVFLSSDTTWGTPMNTTPKPPGVWHHMHVVPSASTLFTKTPLQTASQRAAERHEEYAMLCRGLSEFPLDVARQAHALLTTGNLYRSEKCIGVAKWLLDLHEARATAKGDARENLTWLAVARAPAGFCHVRSGMIGTLLEDVQAGLPFDDIKRKFDAKMSPILYQRPQAAPSAGNLAQAERIVAELASAGSLARRFARLEDLETIWTPKRVEPAAPKGGVFGHLTPKGEAPRVDIEQPAVTMTWEKFARTVLPDADRIELLVDRGSLPLAAMVTAVNADAPPILQWDSAEKRNAVSWYMYVNGSAPESWGLARGWCAVTAIALNPSMWGGNKASHHGASALLVLDGARDTRRGPPTNERGGGFFPELLRSEYHAVRASMEAYARAAEIADWDKATACGLSLGSGARDAWSYVVRVTSNGGSRLSYKLDRWD